MNQLIVSKSEAGRWNLWESMGPRPCLTDKSGDSVGWELIPIVHHPLAVAGDDMRSWLCK